MSKITRGADGSLEVIDEAMVGGRLVPVSRRWVAADQVEAHRADPDFERALPVALAAELDAKADMARDLAELAKGAAADGDAKG